jgi:hypothetical protein
MRQILHYFVEDPEPIRIEYDDEPFMRELHEGMDLPETMSFRRTDESARTGLTMEDFFVAKDKAMPTWPLLGPNEFCTLVRRAMRVCTESLRPAAMAASAALGELLDIALRVEREYRSMGVMGPNDVRYKAHMYLHLQYASLYRLVFIRANALSAFEKATDAFVSRLPAAAFVTAVTGQQRAAEMVRRKTVAAHRHTVQPSSSAGAGIGPRVVPQAGCYLCPAADHYCNNELFHPKVNGRYERVPRATKALILKRVRESTEYDAATKVEQEKTIKDFWSRHSL